ncbi:hypothetical protein DYB32_002769 [Aphanomyces invadans]|uniref:Uncharacterized protein n=1 Tax=Aphanomyces invadans TaxID=157072 RepID=A0A418B2I6_9STRA|nr:hypothetical protein DYB32_002769 [Aphanomyces invadans]
MVAPSRQARASPLRYYKKDGKVFVSDRQKLTERSRLSNILLGNEHWDLFHGIPKGFSLRTRVRIKLETSDSGYAWDMFQTLVSLVACAVCVVQSYHDDVVVPEVDLSFGVIFATDYCLRLYCAKNRLLFPFTFSAIIDLLAVAPTIYDYVTRDSSTNPTGQRPKFAFLRFVRVLRIMKAIQMSRHSATKQITAIQQQLLSLGLLVTSIVFISACLFQLVENSYRDPIVLPNGETVDRNVTLGDSFYFIMVTISTVGYGDIAYVDWFCRDWMILVIWLPVVHVVVHSTDLPATTLGKFVTCAMIMGSLVLLPQEVNRLVALLAMQSPFRKTYIPDPNRPHVLLLGHVSNASVLLDFFTEFYHPDRIVCGPNGAASINNIPCIIMAPAEPSEEVRALLVNPLLQREYVEGSTMEIYTTTTPSYLVDLSFTKAADMLYDIFDGEVILVGVHEGASQSKTFVADPTGYTRPSLSNVLKDISTKFLSEELRHPLKRSPRAKLHKPKQAPQMPQPWPLGCVAPQHTFVNPGANYVLRPHHTLYVLCESRNVAQLVSCPDCYNAWVRRGNNAAQPNASSATTRQPRYAQPYDLLQANSRLVSTRIPLSRRRDDVCIVAVASDQPDQPDRGPYDSGPVDSAGASSPATKPIRDHIIVVSDLIDVPIETFIKPLRLAHYTDGSKHYRPIVFVSTSNEAIDVAYEVARHYDGVYLMRVTNDSKETFFRAGIMKAQCCVLLAEKSGQRVMDGESLDNRVIFRYLTVQKILEKHSAAMNTEFAVFVEMAALAETHKLARKRKEHMKTFKKRHTENKATVVLPFYAAGYGVPTDFFDSLLCQSYFTPELLRFAQELLCMDQRSHDSMTVSSSVSQIPLPDSFVGKTFGDLYTYLLTYESVIAIGLYRNSASRVTLPYVYTAPKRSSVLRSDDFVFILAQPHTQIALENAIDFEADVVESRGTQHFFEYFMHDEGMAWSGWPVHR